MSTFLDDPYLASMRNTSQRHTYAEPDKRRGDSLFRLMPWRAWGVLACCLAFGFLWYIDPGRTYVAPPPPPPVPRAAYVPGTSAFHHYAFSAAKGFARDIMLTPSTAKFPPESVRVSDVAKLPGVYVVTGNVDAQNVFGAMIRQPYHISMRFLCASRVSDEANEDCWKPMLVQVGPHYKDYTKSR